MFQKHLYTIKCWPNHVKHLFYLMSLTNFCVHKTNRCTSAQSTALKPFTGCFYPCATSMHLKAPLPLYNTHQVSPCIAAPCSVSFRFFFSTLTSETNVERQKTSQSPTSLSSAHCHTHTLPPHSQTKAFKPTTPPLPLFVRRGRAVVAMAMRLLLRLICADHL